MNSIQLIIFDLDGTLLDTLSDITNACNHALAALGQPPHPVDDYKLMVGEGADVLVRKALPANRQDLAERALGLFKDYYNHHPADTTHPYEQVPELLDDLAARGMGLAILTNKPQSTTDLVTHQLLGRWRWLAVAGHRAGVPKKPDPSAALTIAAQAGVQPGSCAFLGDSHVDMRTARAAGMLPIGAQWGFRTRQELLDSGARYIARTPLDVLRLI